MWYQLTGKITHYLSKYYQNTKQYSSVLNNRHTIIGIATITHIFLMSSELSFGPTSWGWHIIKPNFTVTENSILTETFERFFTTVLVPIKKKNCTPLVKGSPWFY